MAIFAQFQGSNQRTLFTNCRSRLGTDWPTRGVSVIAENGALKVITPYSSAFVEELKMAVPATSRKWDPSSKAWLVSTAYAGPLKEIIDRSYNCDVVMPTVIAADNQLFEITFQADYVANCKNEASSVHSNGGWNAKIPEKVLRAWFKQVDNFAPATLYGVLGLDKTVTEIEIKKAYKRAARQWHPDVCKEDNAREMFETIKDAYQILIDPNTRNKYNAGLIFEQMAKTSRYSIGHFKSKYTTFTPTLRCGMLTVKARKDLGVLIVEEILAWEDIENETGQIMVSFWADDSWSVAWV